MAKILYAWKQYGKNRIFQFTWEILKCSLDGKLKMMMWRYLMSWKTFVFPISRNLSRRIWTWTNLLNLFKYWKSFPRKKNYNLDQICIHIEGHRPKIFRQCYLCQLFSRNSAKWSFTPRRIQCAHDHLIRECSIKDRSMLAKCNYNYPDNYSFCPAHPIIRKNILNLIRENLYLLRQLFLILLLPQTII